MIKSGKPSKAALDVIERLLCISFNPLLAKPCSVSFTALTINSKTRVCAARPVAVIGDLMYF